MKVSEYILNQVSFEPKYDDIKGKVDVSQYVEKKIFVKRKKLNTIDIIDIEILLKNSLEPLARIR